MENLLNTSLEAILTKAPVDILHANSEAYEWLVGKIQAMDRRKNAEAVVRKIEEAAFWAGQFHSGRFADGAIENIAFEIGAGLDESAVDNQDITLPVASKRGDRRVLHIAPHVGGIGGHTRTLYHHIRNDQSSCHWLVLTNQTDRSVPAWLSEVIRSRGGDLIIFPSGMAFCQKALWLRKIARQYADLVLLHPIYSDVLPTLAFSTAECPPVAVIDHVDFQFWLGSSIADMLIGLRTAAAEHTARWRFIPHTTVLPIPLAPVVPMSRRTARRTLGIGEDQVVLLSVGRRVKYRPIGPYDFVATANKILDRQPRAHLYVIGESAAGIAPYLRCGLHDRLHFVGSVEDPSLYRAAADIYLESFPFGSNIALLEAALSGLPVVPTYAPLCPMLVANADAITDILINPRDEQEYVERVERLIQQRELRSTLGETLRERLLTDHLGDGWLEQLAALYQKTDRLTHSPRPIAVSPCSTTTVNIGLSLWNVIADGKNSYSSWTPGNLVVASQRHAAYVAKLVGNYPKARRSAWRAVQHNPYQRASWRLLAVTLLGKTGRFLR